MVELVCVCVVCASSEEKEKREKGKGALLFGRGRRCGGVGGGRRDYWGRQEPHWMRLECGEVWHIEPHEGNRCWGRGMGMGKGGGKSNPS